MLSTVLFCALLGAVDGRVLPMGDRLLTLRGGGKAAPPPPPMISLPEGFGDIGGAAGIGSILGFCAGKVWRRC